LFFSAAPAIWPTQDYSGAVQCLCERQAGCLVPLYRRCPRRLASEDYRQRVADAIAQFGGKVSGGTPEKLAHFWLLPITRKLMPAFLKILTACAKSGQRKQPYAVLSGNGTEHLYSGG
jgi:hypothetical protein